MSEGEMSTDDIVDEVFVPVIKRVEKAYDKAVDDLKARVRTAKEEALKRIDA